MPKVWLPKNLAEGKDLRNQLDLQKTGASGPNKFLVAQIVGN